MQDVIGNSQLLVDVDTVNVNDRAELVPEQAVQARQHSWRNSTCEQFKIPDEQIPPSYAGNFCGSTTKDTSTGTYTARSE